LLWFGVALFCFAAALYFSGRERQYVEETVRLRRQLEADAVELADWRQAAPILNASDTVELKLRPNTPDGPSAHLFIDPGRSLALIASRLPSLSPDKRYEMWIKPEAHAPIAAGLFASLPDGSAVHVVRNASATVAGATILVTVETSEGAQTPSAPRVFEASIPNAAR
jgi:hypothetical protein